LNLNNNRIKDLSSLIPGLPNSNLKKLSLWVNEIEDITPLASALPGSNLQILELRLNQISNLSAFAQALMGSNLKELYLGGNQIKDLSGLTLGLQNSSLQLLDLSRNRITDFSMLAKVLNKTLLELLDVSMNSIQDLTALEEGLPNSNLQKLYISSNKINNISALGTSLPHSNLLYLGLNYNEISDLSPLTLGLAKLQILDISNNLLTNFNSFIEQLPNSQLQSLFLDGNDLGEKNAKLLASTLVRFPAPSSTLWVNSLDPDQRQAISHGQPNTLLHNISLAGTNINTSAAIALCRALPLTKMPLILRKTIDNYPILSGNPIDSNVVDINTCQISAGTNLDIPWPLKISFRFFSAITEYPRNWFFSLQKTLMTKQNMHDTNNIKPKKSRLYSKMNLQNSMWKLPAETTLALPTFSQHQIIYTSLALQMNILTSQPPSTTNTSLNNYPLFDSQTTLPKNQNKFSLNDSIDIISGGQLSMLLLLTLLGTLLRSFLPRQQALSEFRPRPH
jgi:hypothetical protein